MAMRSFSLYSDAPNDIKELLLNGKRIDDFLPPPYQLVKRVPKVKVTIALNQQSLEFFKKAEVTASQTLDPGEA